MNCHFTPFSCHSPQFQPTATLWFWQVLQHSEVPITGASLPLVAVLVPQGGTMKRMLRTGIFFGGGHWSCLVLWVAISKQKYIPNRGLEGVLDMNLNR